MSLHECFLKRVLLSSIITQILTYFQGEAENLNAVTEVMYGVRDFFDATVGRQLLYNIEKPQFSTVMEQVRHITCLKAFQIKM